MAEGSLGRESAAYRRARRELWEAEVALKEQREQVAALRRKLPLDTGVEDYRLMAARLGAGDPAHETTLGRLFEDPSLPLVLMHFMFGKGHSSPCPMCTLWADGYQGVVRHLSDKMNFAIAIAGDVEAFRAFASERRWAPMTVVSTAGVSLKADVGMELADGEQLPGVSVFVRDGEQVIHAYTGGAIMGDGHYRGLDLLCPAWHFLDLTPAGRGDWMPCL